MKKILKDSLTLLQGYYSYFLISAYTDVLLKNSEIPIPKKDITLKTSSQNAIKLNTTRITELIVQIQNHPNDKNVYGYISFISSIKGLFGIFLDMYARHDEWKSFLKQTLGGKYDEYTQTIRLCRNLLTHQTSPTFILSKADIRSAQDKLLETGKRIITYSFLYKDIFGKHRKGSATYGFHISINTETMLHKKTLFGIIDEHTMFVLAESVYNLSELFKTLSEKKK